MRFSACAECNEYKYIEEDGKCPSCVESNSELRDAAEELTEAICGDPSIVDETLIDSLRSIQDDWRVCRDELGMEGVPYHETGDFKKIVLEYVEPSVHYYSKRREIQPLLTNELRKRVERTEARNHFVVTGDATSGKTDTAYLIAELMEQEFGYNVIVESDNEVAVDPVDRMVEGKHNVFLCDEFGLKYDSFSQKEILDECARHNISTIFVSEFVDELRWEVQRVSTFIKKLDTKTAEVINHIQFEDDGERTEYHVPACENYNYDTNF